MGFSGGFVGAVLMSITKTLADNHLLAEMLFGLATSLLPWLVLLPSFGWVLFGFRGPQGSNALLASTLSRVPYGFGIGAVIALSRQA